MDWQDDHAELMHGTASRLLIFDVNCCCCLNLILYERIFLRK